MDHSLILWEETAHLADRGILRLALLRSIHHTLHAQASHFLAIGQQDVARSLQLWDSRIEELGKHSLRENPFESSQLVDFLTYTHQLPTVDRTIPETILTHLDPTKLNRSDRTWEKLLAGEASALGWHYWRMSTQMNLHDVQKWNELFSETLWPNGTVLWTEVGPDAGPDVGAHAAKTPEPGEEKEKIWRGEWLIVLSPEISQPWATFQIHSEFSMEWTELL